MTKRQFVLLPFLVCVSVLLGAADSAQSEFTFVFSEFSSDKADPYDYTATDPADIPALVTFDLSGSTLNLEIQNLSSYEITRLYFNTEDRGLTPTKNSRVLTDVELSLAPDFTSTFKLKTATSATKKFKADGFGLFDFRLNLSAAAVGSSTTTTIVLNVDSFGDVTDPFVETDIQFGWSSIPPGHQRVNAVLKFQHGPTPDSDDDDSAFGGTTISVSPPGPIIPEPASVTQLGLLVLTLLFGYGWRRRRFRTAA